MRERFVTALILVAIAAIALVGCDGAESEGEAPTAIPIADLVTPSPTRMAEQVMNTPTPEPAPTEQVMATPTDQVMATPTDIPVTEPSATPEPTEPVMTPTEAPEVTETPEATEPEETPTAEPTDEATAEPTAEPTPEPTAEPTVEPTPEPVTHTVQAGENLFRIGLRYGVSWQEIAAANNLPAGNRIQVGQVLTIPVEPVEAPEPVEGRVHIVRAGETLFRIGLQYNVAWDAIARANGITNPNTITVGQELIIPGQTGTDVQGAESTEEPTEGGTGTTIHVVQPGETLFRIGLLYGMSWQVIAEVNGITNPNYITVGTALTIPAQ